MINIVKSGDTSSDSRSVVVVNSTDTKPVKGITHGSLCEEVDTGSVYLFDEENERWVEV